jgi:hypothetical protein
MIILSSWISLIATSIVLLCHSLGMNDIMSPSLKPLPIIVKSCPSVTLKTLGISHCFSDEFRDQQLQQMMELEKIADDMLVVIISEIYLDKLIVFSKLEKMFSGFEENGIKPLYIFMGSFFSMNYYIMNNGKQIMKNAFSALADMICKYPMQREQAKFLFVPGNICLYIYMFIYIYIY